MARRGKRQERAEGGMPAMKPLNIVIGTDEISARSPSPA
jgi:hypothetical protein